MGWVSVGVVFGVMTVWNLVHLLGVCYAPCSTPWSYYFYIFAMLSFSSPARLIYVAADFCPG